MLLTEESPNDTPNFIYRLRPWVVDYFLVFYTSSLLKGDWGDYVGLRGES